MSRVEASSYPRIGEAEAGSEVAPLGGAAIVVGRYQGTVVVTVHGVLDIEKAGQLGGILVDLIDGQGNMSIVVDLHHARAGDADSLWVFADAAERAQRRGASMSLNAPPPIVQNVLQLRGLDDFVGIVVEHSGVGPAQAV